MNIEQYILGQQEPFTFHSVLNQMIDDGANPELLQQTFDWLRAQFRIMVVGCTPFGEDVFEVVIA